MCVAVIHVRLWALSHAEADRRAWLHGLPAGSARSLTANGATPQPWLNALSSRSFTSVRPIQSAESRKKRGVFDFGVHKGGGNNH